jgi:hypothetical protein
MLPTWLSVMRKRGNSLGIRLMITPRLYFSGAWRDGDGGIMSHRRVGGGRREEA